MKRREFLLGLAAGSAVLATPALVAAQRRLTDAERFAVLTSDVAGWQCKFKSIASREDDGDGKLFAALWESPNRLGYVDICSWGDNTQKGQTIVCLRIGPLGSDAPESIYNYSSFEAAQRKAVEFMLNNPVEFDFWADRKR